LSRLGDNLFSQGDSSSFEQRLAEAIAWCDGRAKARDPKSSLRTPSLHPGLLSPTRADAVRFVLNHRQVRLPTDRIQPIANGRGLTTGRLLCYYPDADLSDGAAELASKGFFDVENIPPWDTWVGLYGSDQRDRSYGVYLVSYVPEPLVRHASTGIDVNPESCIVWLRDADNSLTARLREEGWRF